MGIDTIDDRGVACRAIIVYFTAIVELALVGKLRFQCTERLVARQRDRTRPCRAGPFALREAGRLL